MNLGIPSLRRGEEVTETEEVIVGEGSEVEIAQARREVANDMMIVGIGVVENLNLFRKITQYEIIYISSIPYKQTL